MISPMRLFFRCLAILLVIAAMLVWPQFAHAQSAVTGEVAVLQCGIDKYPVFIPSGSNDPWILDPFLPAEFVNYAFANPGTTVTLYDPVAERDPGSMSCGEAYPSVSNWLYSIQSWTVGDGQPHDGVLPSAPTIEYYADRTEIVSGECTQLVWRVENIKEIYLNGEGVAGDSSREVCPGETTIYTLRVVYDGGEESPQIGITVVQPTPEPPRDDALVTWTNGNRTLLPGENTRWHYTFRNAGNTTWTEGNYGFRGLDSWEGTHPPFSCAGTAPTAECEFVIDGPAPDAPGVYYYGVIIQHEGVDFGQAGTIQVEVVSVDAPDVDQERDGAIVVETSGDQVLQSGQEHTWRVLFRNTGSTTWADDRYSFRGIDKWQNLRPPFTCGQVAPGGECELSLNGRAPSEPGSYTYRVVLQHDGVDFGETGVIHIEVPGNEPPDDEPLPLPTPTPEPAPTDTPDLGGVTLMIPPHVNLRSGPGVDYNPPKFVTQVEGSYNALAKYRGWNLITWYRACCYQGKDFWVASIGTGVEVTGDATKLPDQEAPAKAVKVKFVTRDEDDYRIFSVKFIGPNQNDEVKTWPYDCSGGNYTEVPEWLPTCKSLVFPDNWWWRGAITIEYHLVPVMPYTGGTRDHSREEENGSCKVALPDRSGFNDTVTLTFVSPGVCEVKY